MPGQKSIYEKFLEATFIICAMYILYSVRYSTDNSVTGSDCAPSVAISVKVIINWLRHTGKY